MSEKIVIVGNGIAAITAIKSIRQIDTVSEIHLFGDERFYPYNRVALSKGLINKLEEDKILLQKKDWYKENNVNLNIDTKVVSINTDRREVELSKGTKVSYTKLLLANGAKNRVPPVKGINKKGVLTLKTLQDARKIIDEIKDMETIVNIGGGIQGLETAWTLSKLGKKVIIAEISERLMPKELDKKASKILERAIKNHNIKVMLNTEVNEVLGENKVKGFKTKDGIVIECDGVVYSIGIKPNIDILEGTGIETNYGVIVNEKMETNVKDVYAAGDVAEYDNNIYGLWNIAIGQGKVAGYNMVGKEAIYEHIVPVTRLSAFNLSLFSMGDVNEADASEILVEDNSEKNSYKKILIKDNKVIGAVVIGNIKSSPVLKKAIENETDLSGIDYKNMSIDEFVDTLKSKKRKLIMK
ncbi:NAD(P)/FAD-dependent oxidoreductase [Thermohalobacter berrensis]|uniref:Pyridine nucleotide-disulfide oxidoreductase n=1 Tax=Thermohalobacter berrensis TaxID=99594 RepID=A0A419T3D2_9FIRM|nr:FAD-dependent oxidoreductase [Thermohalobacter berrensis]RKD31939.1 pyridine nucleotide-disulfide oxidoreductase [Thermohalobacter berrensis]